MTARASRAAESSDASPSRLGVLVAAPRAGARRAEAPTAGNRNGVDRTTSTPGSFGASFAGASFDAAASPAASAAARSLGDERAGTFSGAATTGERPAMGTTEGDATSATELGSGVACVVSAARGDASPDRCFDCFSPDGFAADVGGGAAAGFTSARRLAESRSVSLPSRAERFARPGDGERGSFVSRLRAFASPSGVRASSAGARAARSAPTSAAATRATALEARSFWRSATGVERFLVAALSNHASTGSSPGDASGAWKSK